MDSPLTRSQAKMYVPVPIPLQEGYEYYKKQGGQARWYNQSIQMSLMAVLIKSSSNHDISNINCFSSCCL